MCLLKAAYIYHQSKALEASCCMSRGPRIFCGICGRPSRGSRGLESVCLTEYSVSPRVYVCHRIFCQPQNILSDIRSRGLEMSRERRPHMPQNILSDIRSRGLEMSQGPRKFCGICGLQTYALEASRALRMSQGRISKRMLG